MLTKTELVNLLIEFLKSSDSTGWLTDQEKKKRLQEIEDVKNMSDEDFQELLAAGQRFSRKVRSSVGGTVLSNNA